MYLFKPDKGEMLPQNVWDGTEDLTGWFDKYVRLVNFPPVINSRAQHLPQSFQSDTFRTVSHAVPNGAGPHPRRNHTIALSQIHGTCWF